MPNPPALRTGTPRPQLVVDRKPDRVVDPIPTEPFPGADAVLKTTVGLPGVATADGRALFARGFTKGRVVTALPLKDGPRLLRAPVLVHDNTLGYLADPDGNVLGEPGIWVHRIVTAVATPTGPRSSAGLQGY